jgi:FMN reductase
MGVRAAGGAHVVGIGGSTRSASSTERVLAAVLRSVEQRGATTTMLAGADIELPAYGPDRNGRSPAAERLVAEVERADGIVIASPGYHGGISGMVKNALDYLEDLRDAPRPYLTGRAVGLIACADGPQATTTTLTAMRAVVHALRGWPTPLGIALQASDRGVALDGTIETPELAARIDAMADQVLCLAPVAAAR